MSRSCGCRREAGAATLSATADGAQDIESTLAELPPTLTDLETSLSAVRGVLDDVEGALTDLRPVAAELPQSLDGLRSLGQAARPAIHRLQTPVRRLVPLADALQPVSQRLRGTAAALRPQTPDLDHVTSSTAGCLLAVDKFFQWTASVFKMADARGVTPRAFATTGVGLTSLTKDPNVFAGDSCAPGAPIAGEPGPGGTR